MKTTHLTRRTPRKNGGFSWGSFPMGDGGPVCYRLFRRDHRGALHMSVFDFSLDKPRGEMAVTLRRARHALRDRVDEIDLQAMEEAA